MQIPKNILLIILCCILSNVYSQKNIEIDSLLKRVKIVKGTEKIDILNRLCWKHRNAETEKALNFGLEAIKIAKEIDYPKGLMIGYSYTGVVSRNLGNYPEAFDYYQKGLDLAIKQNNTEQQGYGYINIGNLYIYQEQYENALENLTNALSQAKKLKNKDMEAYIYINIGRVHLNLKQYDKAKDNISNALSNWKELDNKDRQGVCYKYFGDLYKSTANYDKALTNYNKTLQTSDMNRDQDMLADIYNNIADIFILTNIPDSAEHYADKSMKVSKTIHSKLRIKNALHILTKIYSLNKDYKKALNSQTKEIAYNDSLFNDQVAKKIAATEFSALQHKKQTEINLLNKDKEHQKTFNRALIFGFSGLLVLVLVLLFTSYQRKKTLNLLTSQKTEISEKNIELNQQNEEIKTQHDNLERLIEELEKQKNKVSGKTRQITDSIQYAKRIQNAVLPPERLINRYFPTHFIYYKPRDIVSGDFYWMTKKNKTLFLAIADCTGHGVPGAFMSLLSISFLNEIIYKNLKKLFQAESTFKASDVLNQLREKIKKSLQQTGKLLKTRDGLDVSFCMIDLETMKMQYACAHNSILLVRNGEMLSLKADKMPVGVYHREKPFTNHEIQLKRDDTIYLYSDGYYDQIGGERKRKFFVKRFKELIFSISSESIIKQNKIIETTMTDWMKIPKGNGETYKQIDDMLIMGIKFDNI